MPPAERGTETQRAIVERWVAFLSQVAGVEVIWLEGSLVDDRAHPWSDIDMRLGIADEVYDQLWEGDRLQLLAGLDEHHVLWNLGFIRAVTSEGVVVELAGRKVSELASQELYEWKFLFNRLPDGPPAFRKLPERSTAETWPAPQASDSDVLNHTNVILHLMALTPPNFYNRQVFSAAYTLDYLRSILFRVMYQRLGVRFSKRAKELSQFFPPEFLEDLKNTYTQERESALDLRAIAAAVIRTYAALERHLRGWSEQVGGGFEPEWYQRLFEKVESDLNRFVESDPRK
jgi:hypothetical protein